MWPESPKARTVKRPLGRMTTHVRLQLFKLNLSQASGGNCRALETNIQLLEWQVQLDSGLIVRTYVVSHGYERHFKLRQSCFIQILYNHLTSCSTISLDGL